MERSKKLDEDTYYRSDQNKSESYSHTEKLRSHIVCSNQRDVGSNLYFSTANLGNEKTSPKSSKDSDEDIVGTFEELDPKTMEFDRLVELMHPKFLSDYLGRILTFLKSGNSEICFPNIAPFKEAFLVKLVTDKNNLYCESFDGTSRSICRDIMRELDNSKNVFKWIHSYESGIVSKRVLVYQKSFYNKKQDYKESSLFKVPLCVDKPTRNSSSMHMDDEDLDPSPRRSYSRESSHTDWAYQSNKSDAPEEVDKYQSNHRDLSKRQRNYKALFESLTMPFIMSSLQTVLDFIEDENRASHEFVDMTSEEARFLKTLNSFPFKDTICCLLSDECWPLVKKLRKAMSSGRMLKIREGKAKKRNKLRNVTMVKKSSKRDGNHSSGSRRKTRIRRGSGAMSQCRSRQDEQLSSNKQEYNPTEMFLKALSISSESEDSLDATDKLDSVRSQESDITTISSAANPEKVKKAYNSSRYSATAGAIDWQPESNEPVAGAVERRELGPMPRSKLAQAFSVPVQSDKALKMMRSMGWQGGALGVRGEGITEPIMPAIDIVSGAGLGHTATRKTRERHRDSRRSSSKTSIHFRYEFLQNVLELLKNPDLDERELSFHDSLSIKEQQFVSSSLSALNARKNVGLNSEKEKDLVSKILEHLNKSNICLDVRIVDYARLIIMSKTSKLYLKSRRKRRKAAAEIEVSGDERSVNEDRKSYDKKQSDDPNYVTNAEFEELIEKVSKTKTSLSRRSIIELSYRILFLKKILMFVKSDQLERTISFEDFLYNRHSKFVENIILHVNKREKAGYSSRTENELFADIKRYANCYLTVTFSQNFRSFTLHKKYYQKRFINTSTSITEDEVINVHNNNNNNTKDVEKGKQKECITISDSEDSISLYCCSEFMGDDLNLEDSTDKEDEFALKKECDKSVKSDCILEDDIINIDLSSSDIEIDICDEVELGEVKSDRSYTPPLSDYIKMAKARHEGKTCSTVLSGTPNAKYNKEVVASNDAEFKHESYSKNSNKTRIETGSKIAYDKASRVAKLDIEQASKGDIIEIKQQDSIDMPEVSNLSDEKLEYNSNTSPASSKRSRTESEGSDPQAPKKIKMQSEENLCVAVAPACYPDSIMNTSMAALVQEELLKTFDNSRNELIYLKCYGITEGLLHYKCYDSKSLCWFQNVVHNIVYEHLRFKVVDSSEDVIRKRKNKVIMSLKLNSYYDEEPRNIFKRIELYNSSITTDNWRVIESQKDKGSNILIIEMSSKDFNTIAQASFSLHAGIDKAEFSRVWN